MNDIPADCLLFIFTAASIMDAFHEDVRQVCEDYTLCTSVSSDGKDITCGAIALRNSKLVRSFGRRKSSQRARLGSYCILTRN